MKQVYFALLICTFTFANIGGNNIGHVFAATAASVPDLKTWHVDEGKGSHRFFIEAEGEFRLGFVRSMNYGLSEWYDLKHDPKAESNLTRRDLGKSANGFQGALFNQVMNPHDVIAHIGLAGTRFKYVPKSLKIIENNARRVIVEAEYYTMLSAVVSKEFKLITRYAIYPTGRIYIKNSLVFKKDYTLTTWRHATVSLGDPQHYAYGTLESGEAELIDGKTLRNPKASWKPGSLKNMLLQQPKWNSWLIADNTETELTIGKRVSGTAALTTNTYDIGSSEIHYGWLRGNDLVNPHAWHKEQAAFNFTYWDKTTPAPLTDYARASILLAPHPENSVKGSSSLHSWMGFKRHYFGGDFKISGKKGEVLNQLYFIQLGTENSSLLPNIRSKEQGQDFAGSYLKPIVGGVGVKYDYVNGCYRIDTKDAVTLSATASQPFPSFQVEGRKPSEIKINDSLLVVGKDYLTTQVGSDSLVQLLRSLAKGDTLYVK